jgi:3(or 17)beta-hydroxysteroid dehydrogenase
MGRVTGKTAVVTGAAQGLGRAMVEALAQEGARVFATDVDTVRGEALARDLLAAGHDVRFLPHDVTQEAAWQQVIDAVLAGGGKLDVLVNNAGGGTGNDIENTDLARWRSIISLNLDSAFLGTQIAIKAMKASGGGSIVNVSSVGGLVGTPSLVAYSSAKAGIRLLTKCAAVHCGQKRYGIRVNSIHPGLTRTVSGIDMAVKATGLGAEQAEQVLASFHPIGRIGEPQEIAAGVVFLASDESSFMTGAELVIDGGYTAQ